MRWRWKQISLRSLLLITLFGASAAMLWWNWGPWFCERSFAAYDGAIRSVSYSPDGLSLLCASDDGTIRIWDADGTALSKTIQVGVTRRPDSEQANVIAEYSMDGQFVISAGGTEKPRVYSMASGELLREYDKPIVTVAAYFSPDSKVALIIDNQLDCWTWNLETGAVQQGFPPRDLKKSQLGIQVLAFDPDHPNGLTDYEKIVLNRYLRTDASIALRQPQFRRPDIIMVVYRGRFINEEPDRIMKAFSPRGDWSASIYFDVPVMYPMKGDKVIEQRYRIGMGGSRATTCGFSVDGQRVAFGREDGKIEVWRLRALPAPFSVEFILTVTLGIGLIWSFRRDRRGSAEPV